MKMAWYKMFAYSSVEEYASPGSGLDVLCGPCSAGAWQHLDWEPLNVELDPGGGMEFPDFIVYMSRVPLVSEMLRQALDAAGVDNLFYKRVNLTCAVLGIVEPYWLALPPRIDCLDWEKCTVEETSPEFFPCWAKTFKVSSIAIDDEKTGNYRIFKLPPNTANQEIMVREDLMRSLAEGNFVNLNFNPIDTERI